jgi:tetratricopeptide (TPR) repeat protein
MTLLRVLSAQLERGGDHYRRMVEYEQKRLEIAREIGDRFEEANSLMFFGQIQALNLGDLEGGLAKVEEAARIMDALSGKVFPLLRLAQIQINLGRFEDAQQTLEIARPVAEQNVYDLSRVGLKMVAVLLYNALGDVTHLGLSLEITDEIIQMEARQMVSRQYRMAAACESSAAHLSLARLSSSEADRQEHLQKALETSQIALDTYNAFGYINIVECASEEIYLRHSRALAANGQPSQAAEYLEKAYTEMMRIHDLIPADSPFRRTYLENIASHREIRAAHAAAAMANVARRT